MLASPLMPVTNLEQSPRRETMLKCLQEPKDTAGDRGWMGNPRLPGHLGKSHDQPLQTSATTP